ncbi:MAG: hypothetical protein WC796_01930 [Candidatus Pacearchaeota archaeon]|jgi:hypothetical protein
MSLTLIEFLGIFLGLGGFILGVINSWVLLAKYRKDKPIIKIKKDITYKKHKKFDEISPVSYADKAIRGEFNNNILNCEIREFIVDIINKGHRDARLKSVLPLYKPKGLKDFYPKVIGFHPMTISAGDKEFVHLFFEFPSDIIKKIEKTSINVIIVEFDFVHKKIKEKFLIELKEN